MNIFSRDWLAIHADSAAPGGAALHWRRVSPSGTEDGAAAAVEAGGAADLLRRIGTPPRAIALALPQRHLVTRLAELPRGGRRRGQLVAYDMEPHLDRPVEEWRIIEAAAGGGQPSTVVAAEVRHLEPWLGWLSAHFPDSEFKLIGEAWLLPQDAPAHADMGGYALLSLGRYAAYAVPESAAPMFRQSMARHGGGIPEGEPRPMNAAALLAGIDRRALGRLPDLARGMAGGMRRRAVRRHAMAASLLLAAALGGLAAWTAGGAAALQGGIRQLEARSEAAFREALPGRRLVDARAQLERAVAERRRQSGDARLSPEFLPLLASVAAGMQAAGDPLRLERLSYQSRRGVLTLTLAAPTLEALQQLTDRLRDGHPSVRLARSQEAPDGGFTGIVEVAAL